jgi:hypothetical protein
MTMQVRQAYSIRQLVVGFQTETGSEISPATTPSNTALLRL